jgi:hypothetical protein
MSAVGFAAKVKYRQLKTVVQIQGKQIGRIFAYWGGVLTYFGQLFITEEGKYFGLLFSL